MDSKMPATINTDRSIFACFADFGPKGFEAVVDPSHDRAEVVDRIRRGDFAYENIVKVIEFNAAEGWSRDITDDIREEVQAEVRRLNALEDFPLSRLPVEAA